MEHPKGWTSKNHYMNMGGQCGQSCPCCRAEVGDTLGVCMICFKKKWYSKDDSSNKNDQIKKSVSQKTKEQTKEIPASQTRSGLEWRSKYIPPNQKSKRW